ncbi:kinase [Thraustotheca clavata]|uniref:Kinase n=1 Tax=Thraustotheca clavata TaxID=74557 RepID=A0A1V9Z287_9STRA|nr:kinase [Thraustotheca clavata]
MNATSQYLIQTIDNKNLIATEANNVAEYPWHSVCKGRYCGKTPVVIKKRVHLNTPNEEDACLLFLHNLTNQETMSHPFILQSFGIFTDVNQTLSHVTACPEKGSLKELLTKEILDLNTKIDILTKIAMAVSHLHNQPLPIAHGKLQAKSVWITHDYQPKLTEFEFSCKFSGGFRPMGSCLAWSAPEALTAINQCTEKADVYSFAILMIEVMDPRPRPYPKFTKSLTAKIAAGEVRPEITNHDEWPHELLKLVTECWASNPDDRPSFNAIVARLNMMIL